MILAGRGKPALRASRLELARDQSAVHADSPTGKRYQEHGKKGSSIMLFARVSTDDRAFWFLGPATYVKHEGEQPMAITWRLEHPLPADLFTSFATAVA